MVKTYTYNKCLNESKDKPHVLNIDLTGQFGPLP